MSCNETIVNILPPSSIQDPRSHEYGPKEFVVTSSEVKQDPKGMPILHRNNPGLQQFLRDEPESGQRIGYDGEVDSLRFIGRFCSKIMSFSIVLRYAFYILPVALLLGIPLAILGTIGKTSTLDGVKTIGLLIWLEIVWSSLWIAKLFAKTLPRTFRFFCGVISAGTRKHSLLIKALEVPLSIVFWVIISWATISVIDVFDGKRVTVLSSPVKWIATLQKTILASIPVSCVFLAEKTAIQFITVNYHRTQFSARIHESKRKMHLFELLYEASTLLYPPYCAKFAADDYIINTSVISEVNKSLQEVADIQVASPVRVFDELGRLGGGVTSMFGNIINEVTGGKRVDSDSPHAVVSWALERRPASEALARRVFNALTTDGNDALYTKDIERVLGIDNERDVEEIFHALDKDRNGDVSIKEVEMMVIELGEGRRAMTRTLHDVDRAIKALDHILMFVVLVGACMIYGTVQEFTGSCIFLFIKHPFDIGDRVEINGADLIVEHISLLYTVFRRVDTHRTVQIPNIINNDNWVENISRSRAMAESLKLSISPTTTFEDIEKLSASLKAFVCAPENKRDYSPDLKVEIENVGDMAQLDLRIDLGYKSNWSNEALRASRRSKFMCELLATMRKVPIYAPEGRELSIGDSGRRKESDEDTDTTTGRNVTPKRRSKFGYDNSA